MGAARREALRAGALGAYATTVFFGLLLVLGGALTVALARTADVPRGVVGWFMGGMAAFWILAAAYEVVVPFPISEAQWALPAFSVTVALVYLGGLRLRWSQGPDASGEAPDGREPGRRSGVRSRD